MKIHSLRRGVAILGAALLCTARISGSAATITVSNTADSGSGSLRAALASAAIGDMIDATGVSGKILLTSSTLTVTNSVTILGPGANLLAVDGNNSNLVFYISGVTVTISGLTITNGWVPQLGPAGGIVNGGGNLTVSNCVISGNSGFFGGGIFNQGTYSPAYLNVYNSTIATNW